MDSSTTNGIEVTAAAIDGTYLVLESLNDKTRFLWPLDKIPRPLEIGSKLTLELKNNGLQISNHLIGDKPSITNNDEKMRKLLEALVN